MSRPKYTDIFYPTSFNLYKPFRRPFSSYLAGKNITKTRCFNAFIQALIAGDIVIDSVSAGDIRVTASSMKDFTQQNTESVIMRDRAGNRLNRTVIKEKYQQEKEEELDYGTDW